MKRISVVVPVYNEERNVPLLFKALQKIAGGGPGSSYEWEFVFVDDGSKDGSVAALAALATMDSRVKVIEFTRNFGKEAATTAGIASATGDAVIMIDADLQHPPDMIPDFLEKWEAGNEVVTGVRTRNRGDTLVKRSGSWLFYKIMGLISETKVIPGETDFRLLDRCVVNEYNLLSEHKRMTRSLINWLGFKTSYIEFEAPARIEGNAQYSTRKLISLALHSFVSNSLIPLRVAGYLGLLITLGSGVLGVAVFFERYIFNDNLNWHVSGSAQLAIINAFLIGFVLMALGIIALYIENIHADVLDRPLYVVRKRTNLSVLSPIEKAEDFDFTELEK